jgi:hypothetical protein
VKAFGIAERREMQEEILLGKVSASLVHGRQKNDVGNRPMDGVKPRLKTGGVNQQMDAVALVMDSMTEEDGM